MGIEEFRQQIDALDSEILGLLNRRAEIVVRVGEEKAKGNIAYHSPQREEEIIDRLTRESDGPFPSRAIKAVYREILSACLSLVYSILCFPASESDAPAIVVIY